MAGKSDFTEDEWNTLHRGITGSGMLVSVVDPGFTATFKESSAMAKHIAAARAGSASQLIRELAATSGTGWAVATKPEELRASTIEALTQSVALLQAKAADELPAYRAFALELANAVAAAAKGGDEAEASAIAAITQALGA